MNDREAKLLSDFLPGLPPAHPFHEAYNCLIAQTNNWSFVQWMTERAGGSDVQNTETWATYSPPPQKTGPQGRLDEGDYLISGFKFFSSATDAEITILLAKTETGKLSAFLAPLTKTIIDSNSKPKVVTNSICIHRLKTKLGTKQLPTTELELKNVRAHLVSSFNRGVSTISHIPNITCAHACMGSVAGWCRCLSIAKNFARERSVWGTRLGELPLHLCTLVEMELKLRGSTNLVFFTIASMSFDENGFQGVVNAPLPKEGAEARAVLCTLTATSKAVITKTASRGIQECMEALGGVGYIDDPDEPENIARAFRDSNVNLIWEGTTNVLSSEVVRNLLNNDHVEVFSGWVNRAIQSTRNEVLRDALDNSWSNLHCRLMSGKEQFDLLGDGQRIMFSLAWVVIGLLLAIDAQRDNDQMATELARRWVPNGESGMGEWLLPDFGGFSANAQFHEGKQRARCSTDTVYSTEYYSVLSAV